jgi:chromosome segregation ATPase
VIALLVRYWYLAAIAGLVAIIGVQQIRVSHAQNQLSDYKLEVAENDRLSEELARQESDRRQRAFDEEAQRTREEKAALEADVSRLADAADSLRNDLAEFRARTKPYPKTSNRGASEPGSDPIGVLAGLFERADQRAGELAEYAQRLRSAGSACERAADAIASP